MTKMVVDKDGSVQNLANTIHSLLGLKAHLNSNWIRSVRDIVKSLRPAGASTDLEPAKSDSRNCLAQEDEPEKTAISKLKNELAALNNRITYLNTERKKVLNDYLDLKGNIRVFCRIRPINMDENLGRSTLVMAMDSSRVVLEAASSNRSYSFDKVFLPSSSQDDVFKELEPVIKSALDGYNACIFAYGQTGTGKTFTMEGNPDNPGVVPRTIQALFKQASDSNYTNLITFSMLEIYLGNLKDLLVPQPTRPMDPAPPCLTIQTDPKGGIDIENLAAIAVSDYNQALKLYKLGCHFRSTASTNSNNTSSRSHCLIRISITCFNAPERRRETNKIWLVDLGGSERVLKTKAWGRRLDEGKAINLSLSALGDVINALQRRKRHIPFRNSKLTQVLKDSLGEDSKTLMLVHVSPKEEDLCETICTLNFAARVRSIRLGHEDPVERVQREAAMQNLQEIMSNIEREHQRVRVDIEKLNKRLKHLARTDPCSIDSNAEVPGFNPDIMKKKTQDATAAPSSKLPGFMRPTICSRRKSGPTHQTFEETQLIQVRRRKPPSQRAKSVTFPVKADSDNNSNCSVSRASCIGDLNLHNAEVETVYSQDTSDCDIKMVVFSEEKETQTAHGIPRTNYKENFQVGRSNKFISAERLKVDSWLKSRETKSTVNGCKSRRCPTIPLPQKNRCNGKNKEELLCPKSNAKDFTMEKIVTHNKTEEVVEEMDSRSSTSQEEMEKRLTQSTDSVITDDVLINGQECVDASLMLEVENPHHSEMVYRRLGHSGDRSTDNGMHIAQTLMVTTQIFEGSLEGNNLSPSCYQSQSTCEFNDLQEKSVISKSHSTVALNYHKESFEMKLEGRETDASSERWDIGRRTGPLNLKRRALFMDHVDQKDSDMTMQIIQSQAETQNRGLYHLLKDKVQIICASTLLGLGLRSTGFEHDFFYGLTL